MTQVAEVITEVAARQNDLGAPTADDGDTSPRKIVGRALTHLQHQQSRMDSPRYRKLGRPITTSLMEPTVKPLNHRIEGTETFWRNTGAEAMLQMKGDTLCDSDPLAEFWPRRQADQNGLDRCCRTRTVILA